MPQKAPRTASTTLRDTIVAALAVASFILSGWSLATLLMTAGAPKEVAVFGVAVFDGVALLAALQVYEHRREPHKGGGARLVMMLALIASAVVNSKHGHDIGGWPTAMVLGAAPLAFEVAFELRHRSMTGLIWALFFNEARDALRRDAWIRIAPATEPLAGPALPVPALTEDTDNTDRTEDTEGTDSTEDAAPGTAVGQAPGATPVQVSTGEPPADARITAQLHRMDRAPGAGKPTSLLSKPWFATPDKPVAPADKPAISTPHQTTTPVVTMAQAVREVMARGVTDRAEIAKEVPAVLGTQPKPDSLRREITRQRQVAAKAASSGTGQYL
ncbi:hypothetical protein [Streptomyces sp. NPDC087272]|uniref:hypothetical protein n=1 Tax=Streptomyces sp. NPDC087272 TaxID=3365775 RepID=UPI0038250370